MIYIYDLCWGKSAKEELENRNMKQTDLAKALHVDSRMVNHALNGYKPLQELKIKISQYLGIDLP